MKSKLFLALFGLPFAGAGLGLMWFVLIVPLWQWSGMAQWPQTQAMLIWVKPVDVPEGKSFLAQAKYEYDYAGRRFVGERIMLHTGADNIGSFQKDLARRLHNALEAKQTVQVWVNPENPSEAILNLDPRWGFSLFVFGFCSLFVAVGLGLIYAALFAKAKATPAPEDEDDTPWLARKEWAQGVVYSGAKRGMWGLWGFALFWNLLTFPVAFKIPAELARGEHGILVILLFNLVGVGLLVVALRKTLEWRKFGRVPLMMDPFPGSIGGQVGGLLELPLPYDPDLKVEGSLNLIHSYVSGSGKNRSRKQSVKWQTTGVGSIQPGITGSQVQFRYDVPAGLQASQPVSDNYHKWELHVTAELPGTDFDRSYEIPVYPTEERSRTIPDSVSRRSQTAHLESVAQKLDIQHGIDGVEIFFKAGRHPGMAFGLLVFGAVFAGSGCFLGVQALADTGFLWAMAIPFLLIGLGMIVGALYGVLNSLWVCIAPEEIKTVRRVAGLVTKTRQVRRASIKHLKYRRGSSTTMGRRVTVLFHVDAILETGEKVRVLEGLNGMGEARAALQSVLQLTGWQIECRE